MIDTSSVAGASDYTGGFSVQPPQLLTEDQWTKDQYLRNARYVCSNYNPLLFNFQNIQNPNVPLDDMIIQRWASRTIVWYSYYFGKQQNTEYAFMTRDEKNMDLPINMFQDQTIPSIIKHMMGYMEQTIARLADSLSVKPYSGPAVSERQIALDTAKWALDNKELMMELESYGAKILDGMYFDSKAEMDKYFQEDYKDYLSELFEKIGKDTLYRNDWNSWFALAARDTFVTGFGMMRVYVQAGRVIYEHVPPEQAIWDSATTSTQGKKDRFAGRVRQLSVPEVLDRYGSQLTDKEKEEIQAIARTQRYQQPFNVMLPNTNLVWWTNSNYNQAVVTVAETEWLSLKESGKDENGSIKYVSTRRQATLIGNKFLVDWKECDNIVEDRNNPGDTQLSYKRVTPDIQYGYAMGIVERLFRYANLVSAYETKIIELVARAKGKVVVIHSQNLPEGYRTQDVIADITRMGIAVINSADEDAGETNGALATYLDMTLDPGVLSLIQVKQEMRAYMESVASLPSSVRLGSQGYVSYNSQEFNKAQSNQGIQPYYNAIEEFFSNVIEYGANVGKLLVTKDKYYEGELLLGDKGVEYLKLDDTRDLKWSDFLLKINFDDILRKQDQEELKQLALAAINSQQLTMLDFIKIKQMGSTREMANYLEARFKAQEAKQAQQQQEALQMQQQQMMLNAQVPLEQAQINNEGALQRELVKQQGENERQFLGE